MRAPSKINKIDADMKEEEEAEVNVHESVFPLWPIPVDLHTPAVKAKLVTDDLGLQVDLEN